MMRPDRPGLRVVLRWGLPGGLLVGLLSCISLISPRFEYGSDMAGRPVVALVAILVTAGIVYLITVFRLPGREGAAPAATGLVGWILVVGLAMRAAMLLSSPILEDDFYRYLWDGAAVAHRINPYGQAPADVQADAGGGGPVPLDQLATASGVVVERINHPRLRTIYPPVAQGAFALAHWIKPWSLDAWRLVLFGFDAATLLLLAALVRELKLPILCIAVYWWNPLLVKEVFNAGHMDLVAVPFVLGALLAALRRQYHWAALLLALATGAKLWPVLLLPVILRPILGDIRRAASVTVTYALTAGLILAPMLLTKLDGGAGVVAYGQRWEMNDALFMAIARLVRLPLEAVGASSYGPLAARGFALVLLASAITWLLWRPVKDSRDLCRRTTLVVAAAFLLSPCQFPWYYLALLPLLVLHKQSALLLLTALLPLYYLRFYFNARGYVDLFDHWIVWLEYLPVWILLIYPWYAGRRRRRTVALSAEE